MTDPVSRFPALPPARAPSGLATPPLKNTGTTGLSAKDAALYEAAQSLESNFLAEMLKSAGFGKPRESFGGGKGEEQFSSFLVEAQADALVRRGGIGLTQQLFNALKGRSNEAL